jgi:hypothetical protein
MLDRACKSGALAWHRSASLRGITDSRYAVSSKDRGRLTLSAGHDGDCPSCPATCPLRTLAKFGRLSNGPAPRATPVRETQAPRRLRWPPRGSFFTIRIGPSIQGLPRPRRNPSLPPLVARRGRGFSFTLPPRAADVFHDNLAIMRRPPACPSPGVFIAPLRTRPCRRTGRARTARPAVNGFRMPWVQAEGRQRRARAVFSTSVAKESTFLV